MEQEPNAREWDLQKCAASFFALPLTDARLKECTSDYAKELLAPSRSRNHAAFAKRVWEVLKRATPTLFPPRPTVAAAPAAIAAASLP